MLKKTATFFGEDPNIPAADLLNIFNNFALAYEVSHQVIHTYTFQESGF